MKTRKTTLRRSLAATLVLAAFAAGCSSSPLGRKQLMILPDSQVNQMGIQSFDEMKKQVPVETDPAIVNYVRCIAVPISQKVDSADVGVKDWEIVVFRDNQVNAFALPGGKIGVYTGILPVAKTPDQLAAVLGHEVGHVIARHGNERVSEGLVAQGLTTAAGLSMKDSKYQPLILAGLGLGAQFGYLLPHSRNQESEADLIGLDLMASAGFNPEASVDLWRNMAASGGGNPPEFMSTHPANETRIRNLQARIPEAMPRYQAASVKPHCVRPASIPAAPAANRLSSR
jgi:predicted Zn-dependent protease